MLFLILLFVKWEFKFTIAMTRNTGNCAVFFYLLSEFNRIVTSTITICGFKSASNFGAKIWLLTCPALSSILIGFPSASTTV